ncbi:MAG TPA: hypothetical protein VEA19_04995 [Actinomycetota bacterium]|nr:hypothetical protein [Actinomycetota bacterium]
MATRSQTDRQVRLGRIVGLVFCVAGFVIITIGWNGMASRACIDCQMPYLLSAGASGLGMIMFGTSLLLLSSLRAERLELEERLFDINRQLSLMGSAMELREAGSASANGKVVAGRSTYHRPDCRLVQGRDNLDLISVKMAEASGLSACRVCNPETADATA